MEKLIKYILSFFPYNILVKIKHFVKLIIDKEYRWVMNTYWKFGHENRKRIFLSAARFMNINRPIKGYYFEFSIFEIFKNS